MSQSSVAQKLLDIKNVKTKPLYWVNSSNKVKKSGAFCVTDGERYFGTVGGRYHPLSYQEAVDFVEQSLGQTLNIINYAATTNLAKAVLTFDFPTTNDVVDGDDVGLYVNIVNSLDGSTPIGLLVTPIRMKCMNQYRLMKKSALIELNYRHTNHGITNMKSQSQLIQEIRNVFVSQILKSKALASLKISKSRGEDLIKDICPTVVNERTRDVALTQWSKPNSNRNEWILFNCITYPINRYMDAKNRWSTVKELDRVGKFFAGRV